MSATKYPGVEGNSGTDCDRFWGLADALLAAGLVRADQLPGAPGMAPCSAAFVDGVRAPRHSRPVHNERWMQVSKIGKKVCITKGISDAERERREQVKEEESEARARIKPDPGYSAAHESVRDASALFKVGDSVTVWDGAAAVISQGFGTHSVRDKEGEYLLDDGTHRSYKPGYIIQFRNGETFFVSPWKIVDADGSPTHLRLVAGSSVRAQRPMMSFRG